jgi:predicted amidohydrolase
MSVDSLKVAIAQVPQTDRIDANLRTALDSIREAAAEGADLVCFPETHLPGYRVGIVDPAAPLDPAALDRALEAVRAEASERRIGVIIGTETPTDAGRPYNSAVAIDRDGSLLATHHKSRLTPRDELAYRAGDGPTTFTFDGVVMGLVICFEGFRFPETSRQLAREGAKVIFHPQFNHVLPAAEWKLPVHEALIVARAAENTAYFVSANMAHERNNCRSLIVEPDGLIAAASELKQTMLVTADIDPVKATHAILKTDAEERMRILGEVT